MAQTITDVLLISYSMWETVLPYDELVTCRVHHPSYPMTAGIGFNTYLESNQVIIDHLTTIP